jgi:hypothetical protein
MKSSLEMGRKRKLERRVFMNKKKDRKRIKRRKKIKMGSSWKRELE